MRITKHQIRKIVNETTRRGRLHKSMHDRALDDMSGTMLEVIFSMQDTGLDNSEITEKLHKWVDDLVAGGYEDDNAMTQDQLM